jgi:hypothetical protein
VKRLRSRSLNGAAAISLVLCFMTIAMWVKSYGSPWVRVIPLNGHIRPNGNYEDDVTWGYDVRSYDGVIDVTPFYSFYEWKTPYWKLVILFSFLPLRRFIPWQLFQVRQRRIAAGLCPQCGYDLRVTPDRCPECGTEVLTKTAK